MTNTTAAQPLDLDKLRSDFESWARSEGHTNFMRMAGDPETYDDLILRAQFKAYRAARLDTTASDPQEPIRTYTFDADKGLTEIQTQDAADTTASASIDPIRDYDEFDNPLDGQMGG